MRPPLRDTGVCRLRVPAHFCVLRDRILSKRWSPDSFRLSTNTNTGIIAKMKRQNDKAMFQLSNKRPLLVESLQEQEQAFEQDLAEILAGVDADDDIQADEEDENGSSHSVNQEVLTSQSLHQQQPPCENSMEIEKDCKPQAQTWLSSHRTRYTRVGPEYQVQLFPFPIVEGTESLHAMGTNGGSMLVSSSES